MAAPFKIKTKTKTVLYFVNYAGYPKFSSKSGSVASKVFKQLRVKWPEDLKLIRTTTTRETLIVP
jgi:hypothetical protein